MGAKVHLTDCLVYGEREVGDIEHGIDRHPLVHCYNGTLRLTTCTLKARG